MGNETVNQETQNVEVEQKTFTQDEMNSIISERLGRERQKYQDYESLKEKAEQFDRIQEANKSELQKATERAEGLERELAELKKANEVQAIRQKISNETGVQIRPSKFGGSFNQTFLPLMLWLIWLPPAQDCQDNRRRGGCKSIDRLIILIRKEVWKVCSFQTSSFLPIHRDSAHFALPSYEHCRKPAAVFF